MLCPVLKAVSAAQNLLWRGKGQQALGAGGGAGPLWEEGCPCQYLALGVVASAACPGHVLHGLGAIFPKRASPLSFLPSLALLPRPLLHPDLWQEFGPWRGGGVGRRSELASFSSCCKGLGAARFCEPLRLLKELGTRRYGQFQAHLWPLLPGELTVLEGPGSLPSFQVSSLLTLLASTVGGGTVLGHCLPSGRRGQKEDDLARRGQRPESWEGHLCLRLPAPAAGREAAGCSPRGWPQTRALFPSMRPAAH